MQILVVEDDRKLARQLKKGLDELGHSTLLAFAKPHGLECALAREFDVLVLDVMLPGLDGPAIVRRFRDDGATPILLLTAGGALDDIIDVFIRQLRTRIEPSGGTKSIHTIRGAGYSLSEDGL